MYENTRSYLEETSQIIRELLQRARIHRQSEKKGIYRKVD